MLYSNILVPVALDHERDVAHALEIARQLRAPDGRITALTVIEEIPGYIAQYLPQDQLEKTRRQAAERLAEIVGEGVEKVVTEGHPATSILEWVEEKGVDLVVIASHRPGLQDYFLGSTAARVVRHAPCSVHVLR